MEVKPCRAGLDAEAEVLWDKFYRALDGAESREDPLLNVAVKRIPSYILKLAMLYAASENTLPEIQADQLSAAILVGHYGAACVKELLSLRHMGISPRKELERRILAYVGFQEGQIVTRRQIYRALARHYKDAEEFNKAMDSLQRAGELFLGRLLGDRGTVWVSTRPLD